MESVAFTSTPHTLLRDNPVKRRFREGKIALNSYVGLADPALVEIVAIAGYDAATIDLEHMAFDLDLVKAMILAAEASGIACVVRIPSSRWDLALQVLDAGAHGIQVTHVRDRETARAAVDAIRYAPLGKRGALGASRAARFGAVEWDEYARWANEEILLTVMIEDVEALDCVEEIAAVPGVDLVTVGAHDLAESMGIQSRNDPKLRETIESVARRVRNAGGARFGFSVGHPVLELSIQEVQSLGAAYANVLPLPEVRLRSSLETLVAQLREESDD